MRRQAGCSEDHVHIAGLFRFKRIRAMGGEGGLESLTNLAVAGGFMAALGVLLALLLAIANKKLYVFEDPRIGQVEDLLPKSNCGACGQAGCRDFAEKVVGGDVVPAKCTVSSPQQRQGIADLLGVAAGTVEKQVARLACGGGRHVAFLRARYEGLKTCRAAAVVSGGGKECAWGCLGLADCATVCTFDAIHMDMHGPAGGRQDAAGAYPITPSTPDGRVLGRGGGQGPRQHLRPPP
jgi:Na+-translocating ferredoxin:NAD+ oxidoreductase RNF subunit RnfB